MPSSRSSSGRMRELLFRQHCLCCPAACREADSSVFTWLIMEKNLVSWIPCCRTGLFISPCCNKFWFNLGLGRLKEARWVTICLYLEDGRPCFIEVKSVTLVEKDGVARFPDAPSARGSKHLQELVRTLSDGFRAAVIFVVQREDARVFSPNLVTDPLFTETLRRAVSAGVEIYALDCSEQAWYCPAQLPAS